MSRGKRRLLENLTDIARSTVFPIDLADSKRRFVLIYAIRLFFLVGRRLWKDHCLRQAAALSFQTLLSLLPILAIVVAVASTFEMIPLLDKLHGYLEANLLPEAAHDAADRLRNMATSVKPKTLGLVGGITLVFLSITLFFNIEQVVNEIFRCKKKPRLLLRILTSLLLLLFAPMAFGVSIYLSGKILIWPELAGFFMPFFLSCLTLFLCFWLLPHRRVSIRRSIASALVAGIFLEVAKYGFALYAKYLGATLSYIYGTMAILPLFMIWIYAAWVIFLFGAEISAALHEIDRYDRLSIPPEP